MARTYDEDEVAAILADATKKAAERSEDTGVTLAELEAAASEAGIDGALVRQAARKVDHVEERPRGRGRYGASTRIAARVRVDGAVNLEALANRLFAEMADRVGDAGTQTEVGDARVWQTANFGKGVEYHGPKLSLTIRPVGDDAEVVLREDVDREAAAGVALRTGLAALVGAVATFLVGDWFGPVDDSIALAVLGTPFYSVLGWLRGKAWWRRKQRTLAEAQTSSLRALMEKQAALALPEAPDENE